MKCRKRFVIKINDRAYTHINKYIYVYKFDRISSAFNYICIE